MDFDFKKVLNECLKIRDEYNTDEKETLCNMIIDIIAVERNERIECTYERMLKNAIGVEEKFGRMEI